MGEWGELKIISAKYAVVGLWLIQSKKLLRKIVKSPFPLCIIFKIKFLLGDVNLGFIN
jgi:hypothetical protein